MLDLQECLKPIVGLTDKECPCFDDDRPDDYNDSLSGLFIDNERFGLPLKFINKAKDCGVGGVWDILNRAQSNGIDRFITHLGAESLSDKSKRTRNRLDRWTGYTSGNTYNYALTNLESKVAVYIDPVKHKGVKALLNEVELYLTAAGTYEVNVYREDDLSTPINATPIQVTTSSKFGKKRLDDPLVLDFSDDRARKVGYYVVYDPGAYNPRNIQFSCNCGNDFPWQNHFNIYGVDAQDVASLGDANRNTKYPNGIRLNLTVSCGMDWLCRTWDFSNTWDRLVSEALMLYMACDIFEKTLLNPQPVSNINPKTLSIKLKANQDLLKKRMTWLNATIPSDASDCSTCKPRSMVTEIPI